MPSVENVFDDKSAGPTEDEISREEQQKALFSLEEIARLVKTVEPGEGWISAKILRQQIRDVLDGVGVPWQ